MSVKDFEISGLKRCYDTNMQDSRRISDRNINGQVLPLPNSMETFISFVEKYESLNPGMQVKELLEKLLKNFRIDDIRPVVIDEIRLRDTAATLHNKVKRLIFGISNIPFTFREDEDITEDERCALHFMLSHTINDTKAHDTDEVNPETNKVKNPRESGVVNLNTKSKHALALGRVLLGIYAAYMPSNGEDITAILSRDNKNDDSLRNIKINPVYAVALADLITRLVVKEELKVLPNGQWNDVSCPLEYRLDENEGGFITYSELRGGVDGLLIGKRIQESRLDYANFRLSQILRMYYGQTGMLDTLRTRWCNRDSNIQTVTDLDEEIFKYMQLYNGVSESGTVGQTTQDKIRNSMSYLRDASFNDVEKDECNMPENSIDRKYTSPRNVFAILDYSTPGMAKLNFQTEIIGNLSSDLEFRPRGNLMGVYSNVKPLQQNTLDVVVKNMGTAGCPSCFAKYYKRTGNKQDDAELLRDLNSTLTTFDQEQEELEDKYQSEIKAASPGKIVLLFNFGTPNINNEARNALWVIRQYFGGATVLAIGDNREALGFYVENDQTDIFTVSAKTGQELKERVRKVPAEFTYKNCYQSSASREADNKQEAFIGVNKIQYWAMYPQYFLKSYGIKLRFKSQEGAQIRVCFSRWYGSIVEGKTDNCKDSSGGEIEFYEKDPCKKRNVFNCEPFYFSVEGKKPPAAPCQSLRCGSLYDIQFQFEHEGISCNTASFISMSTLALLFAVMMYHFQRQ